MIAHISLPVRHHKKAKDFYRRVLAPAGYTLNMEMSDASGFMEGGHTSFWVVEHEHVEPTHVAFEVGNKEAVEEFYRKALAAGAVDHGAPGYRKEYWPGYYAAFVLDPDGHNIEAVYYDYDMVEK
jgi:catechol 2,3-dioxygenase-like lactoylglutathione lyase family enzyme